MKLKITIDGETYEVEVNASEPEAAAPDATNPASVNVGSPKLRVPASAAAPVTTSKAVTAAEPVNEERVCRSPVTGVSVPWPLRLGKACRRATLCTNITVPLAGRIAAIRVNQDDPVPAGQIVAEFEA